MKKISEENINIAPIIDALEAGETIVYPTETCYGLGSDATNQESVDKVFKIKERQQDKTVLIVMPDREMAEEYVVWNEVINDLADKYWPGPLTIVAEAKPGTGLAHGVLADDGTIAFRISSHPMVYEIAASLGRPLVSTSANIGGQDSPYDILAIETMFEGKSMQPDMVIDAGDLPEQSPSTIVRVQNGAVEVLRQGEIIVDR